MRRPTAAPPRDDQEDDHGASIGRVTQRAARSDPVDVAGDIEAAREEGQAEEAGHLRGRDDRGDREGEAAEGNDEREDEDRREDQAKAP